MIQSLTHIQRSRRLSQDFDDYLERTSRSSLHSSSSEHISAQYDYEENEAKLNEYHAHQLARSDQTNVSHDQQALHHAMQIKEVAVAHTQTQPPAQQRHTDANQTQTQPPPQCLSKPTAPLPMDMHNSNGNITHTQHVPVESNNAMNIPMYHAKQPHVHQAQENIVVVKSPYVQSEQEDEEEKEEKSTTSNGVHGGAPLIVHHHGITNPNQLLQHLNAGRLDLNEPDAFSDGNASFMDEMSSDSDLEDDEKRECHKKASRKIEHNQSAKSNQTATAKMAMMQNNRTRHPPQLLIHQLPKVPKPRNLNLNVHRQRALSQHHPALVLINRHYPNRLQNQHANNAKPHDIQTSTKTPKHEQKKADKVRNMEKSDPDHRQTEAQILRMLTEQQGHQRAFSDHSAHSSSMQSSVCTPHRRDDDDDNNSARTSPGFFGKREPRFIYSSANDNDTDTANTATLQLSDLSNASGMSAIMNNTMTGRAAADNLLIHINIKVFDPPTNSTNSKDTDMDNEEEEEEGANEQPTTETWMNIKRSDTANDVIAAVIHWSETNGKVKLAGSKVSDYQLRLVDEDEDTLEEDLPPIARNDLIATKGIDVFGMQFIGDANPSALNNRQHAIPDVDWDYCEYEVRDEYSRSKRKCILGIAKDRIHIVLKSNHKNLNLLTRNKRNSRSSASGMLSSYLYQRTGASSPTSPSYSDSLKRRRSSMTGSLLPHFIYVFKLPSYSKVKQTTRNLHQHRWIDARVLTVQKNSRIQQHPHEEMQEDENAITSQSPQPQSLPLHQSEGQRMRQNAVSDVVRGRSMAQTGLSAHDALPPFVFAKSIPDNNLLDNMRHIALNPVRSGVPWDEDDIGNSSKSNLQLNFNSSRTVTLVDEEKATDTETYTDDKKSPAPQDQPGGANPIRKRRKSSVWSFNLFGLFDKDKEKEKEKKEQEAEQMNARQKHRESDSTEDGNTPRYETWNTYNKDGKYVDRQNLMSPSLRANNRSNSNSVTSFRSSRNRGISATSNVSLETDEFTPLSIELCQTISVLKRDNTVFEINFLIDLAKPSSNSKETTPTLTNQQPCIGSPRLDTLYAQPNRSRDDHVLSTQADKANLKSNNMQSKPHINHNRNPSTHYWGQRTKRKSVTNADMSYVQFRQHLRRDSGYRSRRQSSTDSIPNLNKQSTVKSQSQSQSHTRSASNSKEVSRERPISQQSSTRSLSIPHSHSHSHSQSAVKHNNNMANSKTTGNGNGKMMTRSQGDTDAANGVATAESAAQKFHPYQADLVEIWTDSSQCSPSHSASRSSTIELIDAGDYKPSDYDGQWNPTTIIPKLEQIRKSQSKSKSEEHPNSIVKQLQLSQIEGKRDKLSRTKSSNNGNVNEKSFHVFGNDKYLTHTVRYSANSPEDCCQIVRKIQHLMLLESKAMDDEKK